MKLMTKMQEVDNILKKIKKVDDSYNKKMQILESQICKVEAYQDKIMNEFNTSQEELKNEIINYLQGKTIETDNVIVTSILNMKAKYDMEDLINFLENNQMHNLILVEEQIDASNYIVKKTIRRDLLNEAVKIVDSKVLLNGTILDFICLETEVNLRIKYKDW